MTVSRPRVQEWTADPGIIAQLAASRGAFPNALASWALHPSAAVRAAVAGNRKTSPDVLQLLAADTSSEVQAALRARRPGKVWMRMAWCLAALAVLDALLTTILIIHTAHPAGRNESNPIMADAIRAWGVPAAMVVRAVVGVVLALALGLAAQRSRLARAGLVLTLAAIIVVVGLSAATIAGTTWAARSIAACGPPVKLPVGAAAVAATPLAVRHAEMLAGIARERCLGPAVNAAMSSPIG